MLIYKVTNLINNKVYIGQTTNSLDYRKSQHYRDTKRKNRTLTYFNRALVKYSPNDFTWEILIECSTIEKLNELEQHYINFYQSTDRDKGYNRKLGGNNHLLHSETKKLISESSLKNWDNEELRIKMLDGLNKGRQTVIENSKHYFKELVCPTCGSMFKVKPHMHRKFCCKACSKPDNKGNLKLANIRNKEIKEANIKEAKPVIEKWVSLNIKMLLNVKFNDLTFLYDLAKLAGYKDPRSLFSVFNVKNRKEFVKKLVELAKIYAKPSDLSEYLKRVSEKSPELEDKKPLG